MKIVKIDDRNHLARRQTKLITKFKSPSLVRSPSQPPTEYSQVEHHFRHTHLVRLDQDWLSIVALPSFFCLLMLGLLAIAGMKETQQPATNPQIITVGK